VIRLLCLCVLLTGCAAKKPVKAKPRMVIPPSCITELEGVQTKCKAIDGDKAVCQDVVIKFHCVKVEAK
jgi:hypothetical protein